MKGNQKGHVNIRERVFRYMARNQKEFKDFFDVETAGGARRNTMRSTRGKGSAKLPSQEERDKSWRQYIWKMRKLGTWASQLEIKAFVKVYQMDVRIHLDGTTHGHHDCIKASDDSAPREILRRGQAVGRASGPVEQSDSRRRGGHAEAGWDDLQLGLRDLGAALADLRSR